MPDIASPELLATTPRVSVAMITYNHRAYIAQAVQSVLTQETDFPFELIVGDDASTDGTQDILRDLHRTHPHRLRLLLHEKNLGIASKGNGRSVHAACRGTYIAWLEGDDFWIARDKLHRQTRLLDQDPSLAGCFHPTWIMDCDHSAISSLNQPPGHKPRYTLTDFLSGNHAMTSSVMFRRAIYSDYPAWAYRHIAGDWTRNLLNLHHGDYAFLPKPMSVYRVHGTGIWTSLGQSKRLTLEANYYDVLLENLAAEHHTRLRAARQQRIFWASRSLLAEGQPAQARAMFLKFLRRLPDNRGIRPHEILHLAASLAAPRLLSAALRLRAWTRGPARRH